MIDFLQDQLRLVVLRLESYKIAWEMYWAAIRMKKEMTAEGQDSEVMIGLGDVLLMWIPVGKKRPQKLTVEARQRFREQRYWDTVLADVQKDLNAETGEDSYVE